MYRKEKQSDKIDIFLPPLPVDIVQKFRDSGYSSIIDIFLMQKQLQGYSDKKEILIEVFMEDISKTPINLDSLHEHLLKIYIDQINIFKKAFHENKTLTYFINNTIAPNLA